MEIKFQFTKDVTVDYHSTNGMTGEQIQESKTFNSGDVEDGKYNGVAGVEIRIRNPYPQWMTSGMSSALDTGWSPEFLTVPNNSVIEYIPTSETPMADRPNVKWLVLAVVVFGIFYFAKKGM